MHKHESIFHAEKSWSRLISNYFGVPLITNKFARIRKSRADLAICFSVVKTSGFISRRYVGRSSVGVPIPRRSRRVGGLRKEMEL
jgi:hypothetical protein